MRRIGFVLTITLAGLPASAGAQQHHPHATTPHPNAGAAHGQHQMVPQQQHQQQQHHQGQMQEHHMLMQQQMLMEQQTQQAYQQSLQHLQQRRQRNAQLGKKSQQTESPGNAPVMHNGAQSGTHAASGTGGASPGTVHHGKHHEEKGVKHHEEKGLKHHEEKGLLARSHGYFGWPDQSTAAYRNLMALKLHLDQVVQHRQPTAAYRVALRGHLMAVANSPRPTVGQVQHLSNNLAEALATRGASGVNTELLAVQLRAMMNSSHISLPEVEQTIVANHNLLETSAVTPVNVEHVTGDLQVIANQFSSKLR